MENTHTSGNNNNTENLRTRAPQTPISQLEDEAGAAEANATQTTTAEPQTTIMDLSDDVVGTILGLLGGESRLNATVVSHFFNHSSRLGGYGYQRGDITVEQLLWYVETFGTIVLTNCRIGFEYQSDSWKVAPTLAALIANGRVSGKYTIVPPRYVPCDLVEWITQFPSDALIKVDLSLIDEIHQKLSSSSDKDVLIAKLPKLRLVHDFPDGRLSDLVSSFALIPPSKLDVMISDGCYLPKEVIHFCQMIQYTVWSNDPLTIAELANAKRINAVRFEEGFTSENVIWEVFWANRAHFEKMWDKNPSMSIHFMQNAYEDEDDPDESEIIHYAIYRNTDGSCTLVATMQSMRSGVETASLYNVNCAGFAKIKFYGVTPVHAAGPVQRIYRIVSERQAMRYW